jgi:hypothetical protein
MEKKDYPMFLLVAPLTPHVTRLPMVQGSHTECQYKLMTFGVPVDSIPVTSGNNLKTTTHLQWLARRRIKESATCMGKPFDGIDLPSPKDVLFGRGKTNHQHGGNVLMRNIIAEYIPEYQSTTKADKWRIPLKVLERIKQEGGRFLKRDTEHGWWFQVSDEEAQEKISMSFRTGRMVGIPKTDSPQIESVQKSARVDVDRDSKRMRTG